MSVALQGSRNANVDELNYAGLAQKHTWFWYKITQTIKSIRYLEHHTHQPHPLVQVQVQVQDCTTLLEWKVLGAEETKKWEWGSQKWPLKASGYPSRARDF